MEVTKMPKYEYAIWGTKNGREDLIRINGQEVQTNLPKTKKIVKILRKRGDFSKIRIQKINFRNYNLKSEFSKGVR